MMILIMQIFFSGFKQDIKLNFIEKTTSNIEDVYLIEDTDILFPISFLFEKRIKTHKNPEHKSILL